MSLNAQEHSPTTVCHLYTAPEYSISPVQDGHAMLPEFKQVSSNASKQAGRWPGGQRSQHKSKCRASVFRCFLIDTFGREQLREGAGVLDVAGGQGELAFELLNLNGIPATVLEPRQLELQKRCKRLLAGSCVSSRAFSSHNDCQRHKQEGVGQCATVTVASQLPVKLQLPDHLRLAVTPALAACLSANSSSAGSAVKGNLRHLELEEEAQAFSSVPAEWPTAFHHAQQQAQLSKWSNLGAFHEPGEEVEQQSNEQDEALSSSAGLSSLASGPGEPISRATPPPHDKLAAPMRRKAVAWSISLDSDSDTDGEDNLWSRPGTTPAMANSTLAAVTSSQLQDLSQQQAAEVKEAAAAWRRFTECSIVVGIHPDQATDFIVELAIAQGKPFAVVPCCVYSREFPRRMLDGRPVTTYQQLLQYLVAKDPARIRIATLPFQGRNKVLYRLM